MADWAHTPQGTYQAEEGRGPFPPWPYSPLLLPSLSLSTLQPQRLCHFFSSSRDTTP